jgi:hypothetical protein
VYSECSPFVDFLTNLQTNALCWVFRLVDQEKKEKQALVSVVRDSSGCVAW